MRFTGLVVALVVATGCDFSAEEAPPSDDTGAGIGAQMPSYCAESSRVTVLDPRAIPEGFTFAPDDAIAALGGAFAGSLTTYDADGNETGAVDTALGLDVRSVDVVFTVLVEPPSGSDGDPAMGAPESEIPPSEGCAPYYELHADGALSTADGALDERFPAAIRVHDAANGSFSASVALADVGGTARPTDITPSDWDRVDLVIDASIDQGAWVGSAMWSAVDEDPEDTTTYDTATGVGTGTIGVAGMSSLLGSFRAARP